MLFGVVLEGYRSFRIIAGSPVHEWINPWLSPGSQFKIRCTSANRLMIENWPWDLSSKNATIQNVRMDYKRIWQIYRQQALTSEGHGLIGA